MWVKVHLINAVTKPSVMLINMNKIEAVRPRELNDAATASEIKSGNDWRTVQEDMATIFAPAKETA